MTKLSAAGLVYGCDLHHLDHIAVLCSLLEIPLVVTDIKVEEAAHHYYPMVEVLYLSPIEVGLKIAESFEVIFSSLPRDLIDEIFFVASLSMKNIPINIWVPHGNSDKGHASYFMEGLKRETLALVYGQKMVDFIEEKVGSKNTVIMGNYRYCFYKQNARFYNTLMEREVMPFLQKGKPTLLYTPTWEDAEKSCSLFSVLPHLCETVPTDWNLIIKPHPNTLNDLEKMEHISQEVSQQSNALLLKTLPPIYPLLQAVDAYLGDMSSIGYDFLTFKKPMFFLNDNQRNPQVDEGLYLFQCGRIIEPGEYKNIFSIIENGYKGDQSPFETLQRKTYTYTFGKEKNFATLRNEIYDASNKLIDSQQCMPRSR